MLHGLSVSRPLIKAAMGFAFDKVESAKEVMSCHVMSCHVMSCHVMSCHVMSCHVMSCHVMSCHVMSCHDNMITSYHIITLMCCYY